MKKKNLALISVILLVLCSNTYAANEIHFYNTAGSNRYIKIVRTSDYYAWDTSSSSYSASPTWQNSAIDATESSNIPGLFLVSMPSSTVGTYDILIYRGTKSTATSTDEHVGSLSFNWSGTEKITKIDIWDDTNEISTDTLQSIEDKVDTLIAGVTDSNTWYVAKWGNDIASGHTKEDALLTVSGAISKAGDNDTILVWPGDYNESSGIDFNSLKGITIKGALPTKPTIYATPITDGSVLIIGDECRLENLRIEDISDPYLDFSYCIKGKNIANIEIIDCYMKGPRSGVFLNKNINGVRIQDTTVIVPETGIAVVGPADSNSEPFYLINSIIWGPNYDLCVSVGVDVQNCNAQISNCMIRSGAYKGSGFPIGFQTSNSICHINNCSIVSEDMGSVAKTAAGIYSTNSNDKIYLTDSIVFVNAETTVYSIYAIGNVDIRSSIFDSTKTGGAGTITDHDAN